MRLRPGCYPTGAILAAAPLIAAGLVEADGLVFDSQSGLSGAGRTYSPKSDNLFVSCNENVRAYGIPKHRHLGEIEQELSLLAGANVVISFTPHLVPLNRGSVSTIYLDCVTAAHAAATNDVLAIYREFYKGEPFVRITQSLPDTKNVVATNYCDVSLRVDLRTNRLIVVTAIDNLTKGAAGQAVQCLNLGCGYDETTGLL